jgi:hypothetical protein
MDTPSFRVSTVCLTLDEWTKTCEKLARLQEYKEKAEKLDNLSLFLREEIARGSEIAGWTEAFREVLRQIGRWVPIEQANEGNPGRQGREEAPIRERSERSEFDLDDQE